MKICWILIVVLVVVRSNAQTQPLAKASDVLLLSESEQVAFIHSYMNEVRETARVPGMGDALGILIHQRTQIVLPVLEEEAEAELRFEAGGQKHSDEVCLSLLWCLASQIASTGDRYALIEIQKLSRLDVRLGRFVTQALNCADRHGNPFALAYEALAMNDPLIDPGVMEWVKPRITAVEQASRNSYLKMWTEAMVERSRFVPTASEIARDPIAIRLDRTLYTSMEPDLIRLSGSSWFNRKPRL